MDFIALIKSLGWLAFLNPHCDALEKKLSSLQEQVQSLKKLDQEEERLFAEEEETWKTVNNLQETLIQKAQAVEESKTRVVQALLSDQETHTARLNQIQQAAKRFLELPDINSNEVVEDLANLKKSLLTLQQAKEQLDLTFLSSKKLKRVR